jgi:hypothetical protein
MLWMRYKQVLISSMLSPLRKHEVRSAHNVHPAWTQQVWWFCQTPPFGFRLRMYVKDAVVWI